MGTTLHKELLQAYSKQPKNNKDASTLPVLKIFVSYVKPSFLFKSDILTPIHLGREVAKEITKDGKISDQDYTWLTTNCLGDNDGEENISHLNRRVGFLTGTYWAWKNYEKIGNPEYFGSFGYRRFFAPTFLEKIQGYDLIAPLQDKQRDSIKEQFIRSHGKAFYDATISVIEKTFPKELNNITDYFQHQSGYYNELYIMKKDVFFSFCEWIFTVLFKLFELYPDVIEDTPFEETDNVTSHFLQISLQDLKNETKSLKKDIRDIAFIMERLTGYYIYKLTSQNNIKYTEIKTLILEETSGEKIKKMILSKMRENVKQQKADNK